uniref:Uncharacterized protein n=1 Tax=Tetranychus urticae TaxID=32264 RepID=T1K9G1_TETUR
MYNVNWLISHLQLSTQILAKISMQE